MCSRISPVHTFRCQERPFSETHNIRVFESRFAYNLGNDIIGFCMYASTALKSPEPSCSNKPIGRVLWFPLSAQLTLDWGGPHFPKLWGWYRNTYDIKIQQHICSFFNTKSAQRYWVQKNGTLHLPTIKNCPLLSSARYNWRSVWKTYPSSALFSQRCGQAQSGIDLSPDRRIDNGKGIELSNNQAKN